MDPAMPNAPPRSRARGCLLAGCLAMLVLAILPPLLLFSFASEGFEIDLTGPPGSWQEAKRSYPLPEAPRSGAGEGASEGSAEGELQLGAPTPGLDPATADGGELAVAGAGRGRIVLDVSLAELELVPVPAGAPHCFAGSILAPRHLTNRTPSAGLAHESHESAHNPLRSHSRCASEAVRSRHPAPHRATSTRNRRSPQPPPAGGRRR